MSINFLYKNIFIYVINFAYKKDIKFIQYLFYPSLRSIRKKSPKYYFSKISNLSAYLTYAQLKDTTRRKNIFNSRKFKHKYYLKKFLKIRKKEIKLIKITDENYQNFLDFPVLVKNKRRLNEYLLSKGVEVRFKHYYNCAKMFGANTKYINAEKYEKELICLPIHPKIPLSHIDFTVKNIEVYYSKL